MEMYTITEQALRRLITDSLWLEVIDPNGDLQYDSEDERVEAVATDYIPNFRIDPGCHFLNQLHNVVNKIMEEGTYNEWT